MLTLAIRLLMYLENQMAEYHQIFCGRSPWPLIGSPLTAFDTLCTSGFVDDVMFSRNGPYGATVYS